jgi:hypothetical protein
MQPAQGESIMEKQPNSRMCFRDLFRVRHRPAHGAVGLHLAFTDDEGRCVAHFRPRPERQGCPGQLHGGIISTLLVESTQIPIHVRVLGIGFGITARRHLKIDIVGTDSSR